MLFIFLALIQLLIPGDGIVINSTNYKELNDTIFVLADTTAELPYLGRIKVDSISEENLRTFFVDSYSRYLKAPDITVFLVYRVIVLGRVNRPGIYYLPSFASLADVLAIAGGPTPDASMSRIKIINREKSRTVSLNLAIRKGWNLKDIQITSGTTIEVPRRFSISLEDIYKFAATTGILWSVYRDVIKR